jgi:translation initiation factor 4E
MAGYFSNHSQFQTRFANAPSSTNTTTVTNTPAGIPAEARPRPPASRHFSTSVAHPPHEERDRGADIPVSPPVHPLRNTYVRGFLLILIRD